MRYILAFILFLFTAPAFAQCANGQCGVPSRWSFGRSYYSRPAYQPPVNSYYSQPAYTYEPPVVYQQPQVIYSQPVATTRRTRAVVWVPVMVR